MNREQVDRQLALVRSEIKNAQIALRQLQIREKELLLLLRNSKGLVEEYGVHPTREQLVTQPRNSYWVPYMGWNIGE